jgi:hypothetical protein
MKIFIHWIILIASFAFIFIWEESQLDNYTIPLLICFAIIFTMVILINKKRKKDFIGGPADIFLLNTGLILIISMTGNLYSPLYFLIYFLGFGITFIFEPLSVFIYILGAIIIFLPEALKNGSIESFIRLGSLILIFPLAFFFGHENNAKKAKDEKK